MNEADLIVLRHSLDVPDEYAVGELEGRWMDRSVMSPGFGRQPLGHALAAPTGRFEVRDDGAVAEVWEIRLPTPNEKRAGKVSD